MKRMNILTVAVFFVITTAIAGLADESKKKNADTLERLTIKLRSTQWNGGAIGNATFLTADENSRVTIFMGGISRSVRRPIRIHTSIYPGSCDDLSETPAYELNDIKTTEKIGGNNWKARRKIPASLSILLENDHALVIRSSPPDGNRDLFCGDIR